MRRDNGMERVEFLPLRGAATGKDLRAGQRQVADAGSLAGLVAEPSGGGKGTRAPLPRAILHAIQNLIVCQLVGEKHLAFKCVKK